MSNSLDPDQARHSVGPDLGRNCLQILSVDENSKQRVKVGVCLEMQGIFCPSLGAKFRPHSQSKKATFFPNTMSVLPH